uniref:hypothetical protein n=1 Tax=Klebsiella pneumoniae TaxID=573 RepID=UPI00200DCCD7
GPKNSKSIYYSKTDLNHYIKTEFGLTDANEPCTHAWMENGKRLVHCTSLMLHFRYLQKDQ